MPVPGPKEVLVRVAAVGVCGSDVHYYEHGRIGSFVVRSPLVLGHEAAGEIVDVGPDVRSRRVGERVALEPGVPCGACRECRAGRYNLCADVRFFATPPIDGAFANYVTIHEDFAFPLPSSMSNEAGALIEPLSVGVWACRKANVQNGDHVLVTGAGPIGILAMQVALAGGATEAIITDVNSQRLAVAERLGATRALDVSSTSLADAGIEADVLIECTGVPHALRDGIRALKPAGRAVIVGMSPTEEVSVPMSLIQNRELWLTGTFRYANTYPAAIELASSGRVDLEGIITGYYGLEQAEEALQAGLRDPGSIKAMVRPTELRIEH
jgi:L-iditol 2-dehydrogenase